MILNQKKAVRGQMKAQNERETVVTVLIVAVESTLSLARNCFQHKVTEK